MSTAASSLFFALGIAPRPGANARHEKITMPGMETSSPMPPVMDNQIFAHALLDQPEGRIGGGQNAFRWEGQAWIGTDYDKLWLKSEGFALGKGGVEDGQHELLYDRAITTYVDLQAGMRTDWDSGTAAPGRRSAYRAWRRSSSTMRRPLISATADTRRCALPRPTICSSRSGLSCSRNSR